MEVPDPTELVTVYWRPACPYCAALRRRLRRAGLAATEVNIWTDRDAAATVRSIAGGNETVPTVVVAGRGLVNPPVDAVLDAVRVAAPGLLGAGRSAPSTRRTSVLMALQWILVVALIIASFAVDATGHGAASWALDGVALATYVGFRLARRHLERPRGPQAPTGGGLR